jgi:formate hydrogenlyase subunit 3/multisubunit Na+/H+ antiporter MnhD subunit
LNRREFLHLLAVAAASAQSSDHARFAALFYGCGIVIACLLGVIGTIAGGGDRGVTTRFSGRGERRPIASAVAFAGVLGIAGVPLFPTFWGEDLIVHATLDASRAFSFVIAAVFAANGYLAMRNFAYSVLGRTGAEPALDSGDGASDAAKRAHLAAHWKQTAAARYL